MDHVARFAIHKEANVCTRWRFRIRFLWKHGYFHIPFSSNIYFIGATPMCPFFRGKTKITFSLCPCFSFAVFLSFNALPRENPALNVKNGQSIIVHFRFRV